MQVLVASYTASGIAYLRWSGAIDIMKNFPTLQMRVTGDGIVLLAMAQMARKQWAGNDWWNSNLLCDCLGC